MKFILPINVKMPKKKKDKLLTDDFIDFDYMYFDVYEQFKFYAQLSRVEHEKSFITSGPG